MPPVTICHARMPAGRIRIASRSVSGSPVKTVIFNLSFKRLPVSCNSVVLPLPGEEHILTTSRLRKRSRMRPAGKSFALSRWSAAFSHTKEPAGAWFDLGVDIALTFIRKFYFFNKQFFALNYAPGFSAWANKFIILYFCYFFTFATFHKHGQDLYFQGGFCKNKLGLLHGAKGALHQCRLNIRQ